MKTNFLVDKENKTINVEREFAGPVDKVWAAWTQSELLDQWWAPKPWKARTKEMDFRDGGLWLYVMIGPKGEEHWGRFDFSSIKPLVSYSGKDSFSDENGNINIDIASSLWTNKFSGNAGKTTVSVKILFNDPADIDKMIEMGFKEGFTVAMDGLDVLLESSK